MKKIIIEIINSYVDLVSFLRHSFREGKLKHKEHYVAFLTKQYHIIEKALTLPHPRVGFGEKKIRLLIGEVNTYIHKYGEDSLTENVISTLREYVNFHAKNNFTSSLIEEVRLFVHNKRYSDAGGVKEIIDSIPGSYDFNSFFKSRMSMRDFEDAIVSNSEILKAIEIAKYTPSVCNRQGWHVHIFKGDNVKRVLTLQNGNVGFTDSIKNVAIITGNTHFFSNSERNQVCIDAGMFSMSFILALHSLGIGTCALNACVSFLIEQKIRKIANIPPHEKIIMYIALGYPKSTYRVAKSARRDSESFTTFH